MKEPSVKETAYSCPHCGAYTTHYWHDGFVKSIDKKKRYCQMLCTALGSDPVYFDTVNKLYSFNYHC